MGTPRVTFESLFRVFEFFGVCRSAGLLPGHNPGVIPHLEASPSVGYTFIQADSLPFRIYQTIARNKQCFTVVFFRVAHPLLG